MSEEKKEAHFRNDPNPFQHLEDAMYDLGDEKYAIQWDSLHEWNKEGVCIYCGVMVYDRTADVVCHSHPLNDQSAQGHVKKPLPKVRQYYPEVKGGKGLDDFEDGGDI